MATGYLGIDRMKFIGKDLDEEYDMTLEELISAGNDGIYDVELVSKYLKTIKKQRNAELMDGYAQLVVIESDEQKGPLSQDWITMKRNILLMPYTCYVPTALS